MGGAAREGAVRKGQASAIPQDLQALIAKQVARPIFAHDGPRSTPETFQAELDRDFLSKDALHALARAEPESDTVRLALRMAAMMADCVEEIVSGARTAVSKQFPGIDLPGGALYPEFRASACWRDFWHFTRIAHYAVALRLCSTQNDRSERDFLDAEGMEIMRKLYTCFEVPLDAMLCGVQHLKLQSRHAVWRRLEGDLSREQFEEASALLLDPPFDVLIAELTRFTR